MCRLSSPTSSAFCFVCFSLIASSVMWPSEEEEEEEEEDTDEVILTLSGSRERKGRGVGIVLVFVLRSRRLLVFRYTRTDRRDPTLSAE